MLVSKAFVVSLQFEEKVAQDSLTKLQRKFYAGPLISTLKYFLKLKEGAKAIISLSSENRRGLPMLLDRVKQEFAMVEIVEQSVVHFEKHPLVLITLSM